MLVFFSVYLSLLCLSSRVSVTDLCKTLAINYQIWHECPELQTEAIFKKPQTLVSQKSRHDLVEHIAFFKQKQETEKVIVLNNKPSSFASSDWPFCSSFLVTDSRSLAEIVPIAVLQNMPFSNWLKYHLWT